MVFQPVKRKLSLFRKISASPRSAPVVCLLAIALLSFIFSLSAAWPTGFIEKWFARGAFPRISTFFGWIADAAPFAWLDVLLAGAVIYLVVSIRRRHWTRVAVAVAVGYLIFFWSWGINYHREPLQSKIVLDSQSMTNPAIDAFRRRAAQHLNSLSSVVQNTPYDEDQIRAAAVQRVGRVVERLDGTSWRAASRIKVSYLANPWFKFAGIDGLFNPLVHEPIINSNVLDIERPFVFAHELAHVRGYPDEGDANFVGLMATLMSDNPRLQYSGWLELWLYMRNRDSDSLLDAGPRQDIQRIFDRLRSERVAWVSDFQAAILDAFLKANSVSQGVASYSRILVLAAGTEKSWDLFR